RPSRGTHQSSVLSEISSQFHDECSAAPGRFFIDRCADSASARRNLVFGPSTLTTGCRPIVLVTTPPQPASKARMMLLSDSVGGAEESRNGFSKRMPVNIVDKSAMASPFREELIIDSRPMRRVLTVLLFAATPVLAQTPAQQARPTEQTKPAPEKPQPAPPPKETPQPLAAAPKERPLTALPYTPSLDIPSMDRTADPCVDFYQYTCGGWMKSNPIPGDQASWSVYGKLAEENG